MDLQNLRLGINAVDGELLELLSRRRRLAHAIIELKLKENIPLRDAQREEDILAQLIVRGKGLGLDAYFVTRVFHEIIDDSVRFQQIHLLQGLNDDAATPERVTFQGIEGAYSHLAAQKFFASVSDHISYRGMPTFDKAVVAVEEGEADFAVLPVENTTAGNINDVYDILSRTGLSIVGEEIFRVRHCLLAIEDVPISSIRRVLSHPQALAQCTRFLSQLPNCQPEYYVDTAMAVRKVQEDGDPTQAAIASEEAGRLYGLKVLQRDLADQPQNFTRFVIVAQKPIRVDPRIPCKTSIITATGHFAGALNRALDVLSRHDINLTKLDARPKPGSPFDYLFYIDFEGSTEEPRVQAAIQGLRSVTSFLKILGSYPIERREKTPPRLETLFAVPAAAKEAGEEAGGAAPASPAPPGAPPLDAAGESAAPPAVPAAGSGRLWSRESHAADSVVRVRDVEIGGRRFVVIAAIPAAVAEDQVRSCARVVKECGAKILRGGCFRPRVAPAGFEGLSPAHLDLVVRVGREYELPVLIEVVSPEDVDAVARVADLVLIGARNMHNYTLLAEVGRINRPVIVERSPTASLDEFLDAVEAVLERGNHQVVLCERGIRTFDATSRGTLDLATIPLLRKRSHLPIIVDPSYAAAERDLIAPLALGARAVQAHGVMLTVQPSGPGPSGDGAQSLGFDEFSSLVRNLYRG